MKIFFLSPNQIERFNWGWQLIRNEIARQHDVTFYGEGYPNHGSLNIPDVLTDHKAFDVMMLGDTKYIKDYRGIGEIKLPKVVWLGDYFNYHPDNKDYYIVRNNIFMENAGLNMVILNTPYEYRLFESYRYSTPSLEKIEPFLMAFPVDINIFKNLGLEKTFDVAALFNHWSTWCYPNRGRIKKMITAMSGITTLCGDREIGPIRYEYVKAINRARIFIGNCNIFGNTGWKTQECLACGTFFLTDKPSQFEDEKWGYEEGKHLVYYESLHDLKKKIMYYLNHAEERERIAKEGMKHARKYHSNEVRIKQLTKELEAIL